MFSLLRLHINDTISLFYKTDVHENYNLQLDYTFELKNEKKKYT